MQKNEKCYNPKIKIYSKKLILFLPKPIFIHQINKRMTTESNTSKKESPNHSNRKPFQCRI